MNDNTILRIKVPAHLYESVKAQLTLDEAKGKQNLGAGMEVVKGEATSSSDKPKAKTKKSPAPKAKKAKAPEMKDDVPHDGMKKVEKKERSLDELKAAHKMLGEMIAEMEGHKKEGEE